MKDYPIDNEITRESFAKFLSRVAAGKVGAIEWNRFAVMHYPDELIEDTRRSLVKLSLGREGGVQWSDSEIAAIQHWSRLLKAEVTD